jgi:hypothetical protein
VSPLALGVGILREASDCLTLERLLDSRRDRFSSMIGAG